MKDSPQVVNLLVQAWALVKKQEFTKEDSSRCECIMQLIDRLRVHSMNTELDKILAISEAERRYGMEFDHYLRTGHEGHTADDCPGGEECGATAQADITA